MNIYSKNGDKGTTNLVHTKNVSKSDDRVRLFGDSSFRWATSSKDRRKERAATVFRI